ncbi:MAG: CYTH domain-containing protein [Candidatus Onthovivens sp.]|nr:CYTH domain-containing protein [Candidatus Onthovivens sp.]MDY4936596.1 CYTH domain-containing protein [Candidatus Onthovivens sp.]
MATNIEIEAKVLINEDDYNRVLKFYKKEELQKVTQLNYYIDTDDLLLKQFGIGLRIRQKDFFVLNMKAPLQEGLLEKKESISEKEFDNFKNNGVFPNGSIKNLLLMFGIDITKLKIQTTLKTERIVIENFSDNEVFAIDKNYYNGLIDYELELEGTSLERAKNSLKEKCEELNIDFVENSKSKQVRAMETIKK